MSNFQEGSIVNFQNLIANLRNTKKMEKKTKVIRIKIKIVESLNRLMALGHGLP